MFNNFFYIKNILKLAIPIILGNLGFIMIGVGDVIVAGRHSTDTLAAVSIATAITNCIMMFGIGILGSISAILSNYRGEGKNTQIYFYSSTKFALCLAAITCSVVLLCIPFIDYLGFEQKLVPVIKDYFLLTAFSSFGGYIHCMAKEYLQSFEIVIFPNLLTIFCIFLNLFLNIIFVYGYGIIPAMGAIGLAVSSLIVRYFMGIVLFLYCYKKHIVQHSSKQNIFYYKDLLKVGFPVSIAIVIEFAGFNIISVLMGRIAGIYAAAHSVLCTLTSVAFMTPLAISNAVAVKVGFANGAKDFANLKKYAFTGILISLGFMSCSALITGCFPEILVKLFTKDAALIKLCVPIIYLLCIFQIFDGLQVSLSGIFKGLKYTKAVMISNFISYWIISFPIGCLLAFHYKMNLFGFWISLVISSSIICFILIIILLKQLKRKQINQTI